MLLENHDRIDENRNSHISGSQRQKMQSPHAVGRHHSHRNHSQPDRLPAHRCLRGGNGIPADTPRRSRGGGRLSRALWPNAAGGAVPRPARWLGRSWRTRSHRHCCSPIHWRCLLAGCCLGRTGLASWGSVAAGAGARPASGGLAPRRLPHGACPALRAGGSFHGFRYSRARWPRTATGRARPGLGCAGASSSLVCADRRSKVKPPHPPNESERVAVASLASAAA